jgi:hypothetical protein
MDASGQGLTELLSVMFLQVEENNENLNKDYRCPEIHTNACLPNERYIAL